MRFTVGFCVQIIIITYLLSSCSVGKRYHARGFHLEWRSRGGLSQGEKSNRNNLFKRSIKNDINDRVLTNQIIDTGAGSMLMFSVVNEKTLVSQESKAEQGKQFQVVLMPKLANTRRLHPVYPIVQFKPAGSADNYSRLNDISPVSYKSNLHVSERHNSGGGGLRTFGWILIILGALVVLFISIVLGAVMVLLGVLFAISDKKQEPGEDKKTDPKPTEETKVNEELVDVLYLKNGSMIRGKILEFVSGGNVKIQTADGSIFVYKSEEVEKIVKEPVKK